jgi:hypothetical protein
MKKITVVLLLVATSSCMTQKRFWRNEMSKCLIEMHDSDERNKWLVQMMKGEISSNEYSTLCESQKYLRSVYPDKKDLPIYR